MTVRDLLVLGDSLAFFGPHGACAADEPRLWPNVAARELGGRAELVARSGWTARDAWWALIDDPRLWADLARVDAVVLAVGSMDALPSPLPTYLRGGLRYLRPAALRRLARAGYRAAQPGLALALRGRPPALPPRLTAHYLHRVARALAVLRPEMPIAGVLPAPHCAPTYAYMPGTREVTAAAIERWAGQDGVRLLDLPALVGEHVLAGEGNPDGMHWGWQGHERVGSAAARLLQDAAR